MKTREELVKRALQEIRVVAAGQTPSAEDAKTVDDEIVPVLSDLSKRNVYPFGDPDQIEDDAFVHLAIILGNSVASSFGQPYDDSLRLFAESRLRQLYAEQLSGQPVVVNYF